jgi:radical SAM superfamily enzyme YgiQ (UPF0313 family)
MTDPVRVLFADLSHVKTGNEWSVLPMPVNMGYLSAFAREYFRGDLETRICKSPHELVTSVDSFRPHIVAFSNYIWNSNLATAAASWLRGHRPDTLIVMGGPNVNTTEPPAAIAFLAARPSIDFYIPQEGEVPFLRLLEAFNMLGRSRDEVVNFGIDGLWRLDADQVSLKEVSLEVSIATPPGGLDLRTGRLLDLDDIPSPYLTGIMDEYLEHPGYVPLIETNRGCPYSCTFCSWGDMAKSKSSSFPVERILKELDYIAEANQGRVSYLYLGDANFGLFQRDVEIAHRLRELRDTRGFPEHVYLYFAKNSSKRVVEIAGILRGMTPISLSRQSQNADVLQNIKRSNIDIETFSALSRQAKELGVESFAELIYGLPGESLASFLDGVREVLGSDVDGLHFFPAMLLDGSEMATFASRELYGLQGEYRAIDSASGDYGAFAATEFEEIVTTTAVFSREDYFTVRRLHFVQSVLIDADAGGRIFYGLRALTNGDSLYPLIDALVNQHYGASSAFGRLLDDFKSAADAEFVTHDALASRAFSGDNWSKSYKLNPYFLAKLFYEGSTLDDLLEILQVKIVEIYGQDPELVSAVLDVIRQRVYPFDGSSSGSLTVGLSVEALGKAALSPKEYPFTRESLLGEKQTVPVFKAKTYDEFLQQRASDAEKFEIIYDLAMHHSRENVGRMFTWSILTPGGEAEGSRTITNEGGWLY